MVATYMKLIKRAGEAPTELEKLVATAFANLSESTDLQSQLNELYFVGAKEFQLEKAAKSCIVIYVPVPQLRSYQKIHKRLVQELEKKFGGKYVAIVAKRRILPKQLRGKNRKPLSQKRPRSRTLTAVHEEMLADLVYPSDIIGRRLRMKLDGNRLQVVYLDKAKHTELDHKVDTLTAVYKRLTGKTIVVEFQEPI